MISLCIYFICIHYKFLVNLIGRVSSNINTTCYKALLLAWMLSMHTINNHINWPHVDLDNEPRLVFYCLSQIDRSLKLTLLTKFVEASIQDLAHSRHLILVLIFWTIYSNGPMKRYWQSFHRGAFAFIERRILFLIAFLSLVDLFHLVHLHKCPLFWRPLYWSLMFLHIIYGYLLYSSNLCWNPLC